MYENQLSTNLAVDNLNGAVVLGRTLRVDHCKNYKQLERNQEGKVVERDADLGERLNARPELHIQSRETAADQQDPEDDHREGSIDPEDPMAAYILKERRKRRKENHDQDNHRQKTLKDSRKHKRKEEETEEERAARKDAKRIKKLLKEVGASKTRDHDRGGYPFILDIK
jgi:RNA-binding motif X-linked protein 2